jgi:hypothetical protein
VPACSSWVKTFLICVGDKHRLQFIRRGTKKNEHEAKCRHEKKIERGAGKTAKTYHSGAKPGVITPSANGMVPAEAQKRMVSEGQPHRTRQIRM